MSGLTVAYQAKISSSWQFLSLFCFLKYKFGPCFSHDLAITQVVNTSSKPPSKLRSQQNASLPGCPVYLESNFSVRVGRYHCRAWWQRHDLGAAQNCKVWQIPFLSTKPDLSCFFNDHNLHYLTCLTRHILTSGLTSDVRTWAYMIQHQPMLFNWSNGYNSAIRVIGSSLKAERSLYNYHNIADPYLVFQPWVHRLLECAASVVEVAKWVSTE